MDFFYPSRTLNTAFRIHTSRDTFVYYSVDIACTLSLTSGQQGTAYVEIADDEAFTSNVQELSRFVNGNTGTLTIGLSLVQNCTAHLSGMVPAGQWVKIRTQNNTGTPSFTWRAGQECII